MKPQLLLGLLFSAVLQVASALKGDSACGYAVCVNATVSANSVKYQLTAIDEDESSPTWMALGWGRYMSDSHIVVMWKNKDGSTTISQRYAEGHREPKVVDKPPRIATQDTPVQFSTQKHDAHSFAFSVPLDTSSSSDLSRHHLIWAVGVDQPQSSSPGATLDQHYAADSIILDLTKDLGSGSHTTSSAAASPPQMTETKGKQPTQSHATGSYEANRPFTVHEKLIILHGGFLCLGFLVLLPLGTLVARFTRTFSPKWFKVHKATNYLIAGAFIVLGWVLGPLAIFKADGSHLNDSHKVCGVVLITIYALQVFLGHYIHARKSLPKKWLHPARNITHVTLGLLTIALAFFQVRSGMKEWQRATGRRPLSKSYFNTWNTWAALLPLAYGLGLLLLPRQFRQERSSSGPATLPSEYIALSDDAIATPAGGRFADTERGVYTANGSGAFAIGSTESLEEMRERDAEPLLRST